MLSGEGPWEGSERTGRWDMQTFSSAQDPVAEERTAKDREGLRGDDRVVVALGSGAFRGRLALIANDLGCPFAQPLPPRSPSGLWATASA